MARFNANEFNRKVREAQRRVVRQINQKIDQINRANRQAVESHNRRVREIERQENARRQQAVGRLNAAINDHNRRAQSHNRQVAAELSRSLRSASSPVQYTEPERRLADRVQEAVAAIDPRDYDSFLSYARIDGQEVATELRGRLEDLGVAVWFDEVAIVPGRSQSLQMDAGLRKARSGIALLTPAYLAGRFWTERELGALLSKSTLIPVLHNVTFDDVRQYSGILPDLAGFTTASDSIEDIAHKIAAAVLPE
ncbi:toll/interleukin-1 receptor domain-containing protein [Sphingobium sp.]|uniref:toll/interleukin-1 receptor domain-containing protein n=1 Tax=Sphingobium sp. TaxID=1912891 RepID=UPI002C50AF40|nr:toll/interleukin-1 receptor domain-containing protein [Sphingobium sp.]HUD92763.1 toll/interleukin-1 receptor domain-containing protein [Sphingobium sp.]